MAEHASRFPLALDPLIAEAKQRMRRRRSLLFVVLLLLVGAAAGLVFALRPAPGSSVSRPLTSSVRAGDLRVSVPQGFSRWWIGDGGPRPDGYTLTDFRLSGHEDGFNVWSYWYASGPPASGVALGVWLADYWGRYPDRLLHLPLTLDQRGWYEETPPDGTAGYHYGFIRFHHDHYLVNYWSGTDAPATDRSAVLRALRSIRPAR